MTKKTAKMTKVDERLSPQDHAALVLAHHNREQARLGVELSDVYWNQDCERIAQVYKIDPETQSVNIGTGIIGPKEQST